MNLLYSNDRAGEYPPSWYAATATPTVQRTPLDQDIRCDVAIIGAGYTGLSAALHLAEAGLDVVVLEAHRAGFGASGRNGGQLGSGQRMDQDALNRLLGDRDGDAVWHLGVEAVDLVKNLIQTHDIACDFKPGVADLATSAKGADALHHYADYLATRYGYQNIETLDTNAGRALCKSNAYHGGILDTAAGHLHPLNYALGLARAAETAGARIFEETHVTSFEQGPHPVVYTKRGKVTCDHLILACNGYLGDLSPKVAAKVMPINNFIVATKPLGDRAKDILTRDVAVADSNFVVNYFRLSADGRLLFGGGENYGYRFPKDIEATVRKPMERIFPQLKGIEVDYAWGGTLAITMRRMPYMTRLLGNVLSASGYSGHGVGTATLAGKLMAKSILGEGAGFDAMARVPAQTFPGFGWGRSPLLALAMTWYGLRDRVGI
jgi:gamma-glutamylputrescine oxidase